MKAPCIVIGGGLSGLAAAIRLARFSPGITLLEQHSRLGGLNSYYYRNNSLFETGLHAITNYAEPENKKAPLNRLFRQLKISRKSLEFHQQNGSEIHFSNQAKLRFTNDLDLLTDEIKTHFPHCIVGFTQLLSFLDAFDPFRLTPYRSTKEFLGEMISDSLLVDMLMCPLMYYGSSIENDMDLSQFAIMFQAIYREGFFRPGGTIKDFLTILSEHLTSLGGTILRNRRVKKILVHNNKAYGVQLESGEILECDYILSTVGHLETNALLEQSYCSSEPPRLGFIESIFQLPASSAAGLPSDKTVIFFNNSDSFTYQQPKDYADYRSGVICLPHNFKGVTPKETIEVRSTHLASYEKWQALKCNPAHYNDVKQLVRNNSQSVIEKYVGKFQDNIVYEDTFTPVTIERYTAKKGGAIYGSPLKIKDGNLGYDNLFLAGTDQGFLGIIGSMLSGVSIVNQHILPKL